RTVTRQGVAYDNEHPPLSRLLERGLRPLEPVRRRLLEIISPFVQALFELGDALIELIDETFSSRTRVHLCLVRHLLFASLDAYAFRVLADRRAERFVEHPRPAVHRSYVRLHRPHDIASDRQEGD